MEGLRYVSRFAKRDDVQLYFSLVEVCNGMLVGGSYAAIAIFQSPAFEGLALRVTFDNISLLQTILGRFEGAVQARGERRRPN